MGIRSEQLNLESLLRFFVGKNEFKRNKIIELLKNLTNSETNTLGVLGYQDFYNFKQQVYEVIKNEIINGVIDNQFNNVELIDYEKNAYYYESFLMTYPLKCVLDLRRITYKSYEDSDQLFEKIASSNPTSSDIVIGSITDDIIKKISELKAEYIYADKDALIAIGLKQLLNDRGIKYGSDSTLRDLIDLVIYTNPVVTEYTIINNEYLEANACYTSEYLQKYGFWIVLTLREQYYLDENSIEELSLLVKNTNPNIAYVPEINELPLRRNGYYDAEFLKRYGFIVVLTRRGVECSYSDEIKLLEKKLLDTNPVSNDSYTNCIRELERKNLLLKTYVNSFFLNKTIEVDNRYYYKTGMTNFVGYGNSMIINHNTNLSPIAVMINHMDDDNTNIGGYYISFDKNDLKIINNGESIANIKWTMFFDNHNYLQYLKESEYNEDFFKDTFNTVFLKKISNIKEIVTLRTDAYNNKYYEIDLTQYADGNIHNEILFINGVSYPLYDTNLEFDTITKLLKIYNLELNLDKDEFVITNMSRDYYEQKDFISSAYVNPYSSFSEENFAGNDKCVKFKHFLNKIPNFLTLTYVEDTKDKLGNIWWTADEEFIYVYNSGIGQSRFRWFAICDKNIKNIPKQLNDEIPVDLNKTSLFYNISIHEPTEHIIGKTYYFIDNVNNTISIRDTNIVRNVNCYLNILDVSHLEKNMFLEYTNGFDNNQNGKFDNHPFSKPNGNAHLNYSGKLSAAKIHAFNGNSLAQYIPVINPQNFEDGDVIAYDPSANCYEKATINSKETIVGVVCNHHAFAINNYVTKVIPISLIGITEVKVTGDINRGDYLTISNIKGVATSCNRVIFGTVIGKALQDFQSDKVGKIKMITSII